MDVMIEVMTPNTKLLFDAFQEDHADLARKLMDLRMSISEGHVDDMRDKAVRIIETAGAHIAFEELNFYPILKPMLEDRDVSRMYLEHAEGLNIIERIAKSEDIVFSDKNFLGEVITGLEKLEHHVADCGNLFWAVSTLEETQSCELLAALYDWHKKAPEWTEIEAL